MSLNKQTSTLKQTFNKKNVTSTKITNSNNTTMNKITILDTAKAEFARLKADTMATGIEHHLMTVLPYEAIQANGSIIIQYRSSQNFSTLNDDEDDIDLYDPYDDQNGEPSDVADGAQQNFKSAQILSY